MNTSNLLNNTWIASTSNATFENRNPAHWSEVIGLFPRSTKEDVDHAVNASRAAFNAWRLTPAPKRGDIVRIAGDILTRRKDEIAAMMTREMGKTMMETRGDVQEAIDTAYYAATEGRRLFGNTVPSELPNKLNLSFRMPIGVCAVITAWNFPVAVPSWKIFPALVCGNTIVFKPSEDAPASANMFVECLIEAGIPSGVINIVHGDASCGEALVAHSDVNLVAFTGSTDVGKKISRDAADTLKRVSLELGGKNAQIVMADADLDLALDGILWGAFGTSGQRCTATSRLILHESIHDQFIERLKNTASRLVVGDGMREGTQIGPIINEKQLHRIESYIAIGKQDGATCVMGGEPLRIGDYADGWFFPPTIFTGVTGNMRIAREEIFGPVLSVMKTTSLSHAVTLLNDTNYGLSSSVYTNDINAALQAVRDIEAGITYVNGPTIGAEAHMPFGGVKQTGNGHREGGWTAFEIFSEWKSVYIDYSGKLQRAQIDNS